MKQLVVDSSVFISNLISGETNHASSRRFFSFANKNNITLYLPMSGLFEVLHVYLRKSNKQKRDQLYQKIINANMKGGIRLINLEATFLLYFVAFHELFSIKTADTVIALTAHRLKLPLITWDKQLIKGSQKNITAMDPETFLTDGFPGRPDGRAHLYTP